MATTCEWELYACKHTVIMATRYITAHTHTNTKTCSSTTLNPVQQCNKSVRTHTAEQLPAIPKEGCKGNPFSSKLYNLWLHKWSEGTRSLKTVTNHKREKCNGM